jgi:hypothetical protein
MTIPLCCSFTTCIKQTIVRTMGTIVIAAFPELFRTLTNGLTHQLTSTVSSMYQALTTGVFQIMITIFLSWVKVSLRDTVTGPRILGKASSGGLSYGGGSCPWHAKNGCQGDPGGCLARGLLPSSCCSL